ncbi:hypothetical protein F4859DRAFT_517099 [Xylaria cf. heliscus]|nr:hypothetical protein F4859DRAFT_517099 [Xylaria cf. heliscus]
MSTGQQPEHRGDIEKARLHIQATLNSDDNGPVNLYLRGDQGQPLADLPFEIWKIWARTQAPRPRFILLERNDVAVAESEGRLTSQVGPDVEVKQQQLFSDHDPSDGYNEKQILISTAGDFLLEELNKNPQPGPGVVIVMHNICPPITIWDRVWLAGLTAWVRRISPKIRVRTFLISKVSPIPISMPGNEARLVLTSPSQPSIRRVSLNTGTITNRTEDAVRFAEQVFLQDSHARVAFILDHATVNLVFPIVERSRENTGSTGPSSRQPSTDAATRTEQDGSSTHEQEGTSQPTNELENTSHPPTNKKAYRLQIASDYNALDHLLSDRDEQKGPLLILLTMEIQQLDGYQLGLRSVVVFEPMMKLLQYMDPVYKTELMQYPLSNGDIAICYGLLGMCRDGPQQSLVRCVLDDAENPHTPFLYSFDMMAMLFLAIGFGVTSPLALDSMIVDRGNEEYVSAFLKRLLQMKAIRELDEDSQPGTSSSGSRSNRKFELGTDHARAVFEHMAQKLKADFNYAWLTVTAAKLDYTRNCTELDFSCAMARLTAVLSPANENLPILSTNVGADIDKIMDAATGNLAGELSDWQERGSLWYTIMVLDIAQRQNIRLNPHKSDFQPTVEISEGLYLNAGLLSRIKLDAKKMEQRLRIRGPIFEESLYPLTRARIDITYTMLVRAVVEAYPHNLVLLLNSNDGDGYPKWAWDLASHRAHRINLQSFHRVRLPKVSGIYIRVFAVYLTLKGFPTDLPNTYVEDILVVPDEIIDDLKKERWTKNSLWEGAEIKLTPYFA